MKEITEEFHLTTLQGRERLRTNQQNTYCDFCPPTLDWFLQTQNASKAYFSKAKNTLSFPDDFGWWEFQRLSRIKYYCVCLDECLEIFSVIEKY